MPWTTDQDIILESYLRDGFVVIDQLYDADEVTQLRANVERYIEQVVPHVPAMDVFYEEATSRSQIRMLPRMGHHDPYFESLLTDGRLFEVARVLCGSPVAAHDVAYFNKPPIVGDITPPHQDGFYFHLEPCEALTLWLALDEVDEQQWMHPLRAWISPSRHARPSADGSSGIQSRHRRLWYRR